ncbi:DinB family protein [Bacillus suaedaesalsae]|uniref:DinB family protein n=1 Tax=Bacillus suaedaesalsae TaxID=2810349 RepID=A0ABS2DGW5_9BACI|nr:DinB family protein [Bacillus suaedaesalsae]
MKKTDIILEHEQLVDWVKSLHSINETFWFMPFSEGKWGTADVISHFITWDRFMQQYRFPYIEKELPFPKIDINLEKMNKDASVYARSGIGKGDLIEKYIETRGQVVQKLKAFPEELYMKKITVGNKELSVGEYFFSHLEHDRKHVQQINDFIAENK